MLRRRNMSRRQARRLARLLAALDALDAEQRAEVPPRRLRLALGPFTRPV